MNTWFSLKVPMQFKGKEDSLLKIRAEAVGYSYMYVCVYVKEL